MVLYPCFHFEWYPNLIDYFLETRLFLAALFCLDFSGYLFISDGSTNGVSVFSLDGKQICKVGENTIAWEDGVKGPTGVCVTKDNKAVCAFSRGESVICF